MIIGCMISVSGIMIYFQLFSYCSPSTGPNMCGDHLSAQPARHPGHGPDLPRWLADHSGPAHVEEEAVAESRGELLLYCVVIAVK